MLEWHRRTNTKPVLAEIGGDLELLARFDLVLAPLVGVLVVAVDLNRERGVRPLFFCGWATRPTFSISTKFPTEYKPVLAEIGGARPRPNSNRALLRGERVCCRSRS